MADNPPEKRITRTSQKRSAEVLRTIQARIGYRGKRVSVSEMKLAVVEEAGRRGGR